MVASVICLFVENVRELIVKFSSRLLYSHNFFPWVGKGREGH